MPHIIGAGPAGRPDVVGLEFGRRQAPGVEVVAIGLRDGQIIGRKIHHAGREPVGLVLDFEALVVARSRPGVGEAAREVRAVGGEDVRAGARHLEGRDPQRECAPAAAVVRDHVRDPQEVLPPIARRLRPGQTVRPLGEAEAPAIGLTAHAGRCVGVQRMGRPGAPRIQIAPAPVSTDRNSSASAPSTFRPGLLVSMSVRSILSRYLFQLSRPTDMLMPAMAARSPS